MPCLWPITCQEFGNGRWNTGEIKYTLRRGVISTSASQSLGFDGFIHSQHFGYLAERSYPSSVDLRLQLLNLNDRRV